MTIPMDKLVNHDKNNYEITCAIIKRAAQITLTGLSGTDYEGEKVVSTAIKQLLTGEVEFRREE